MLQPRESYLLKRGLAACVLCVLCVVFLSASVSSVSLASFSSSFALEKKQTDTKMLLRVVFAVNVHPAATPIFDRAYALADIYLSRLAFFPAASFHLELTAGFRSHADNITALFFRRIPNFLHSNCHVKITWSNQHEFPGIFRAFKLGSEFENDIIAYVHNKGATKKKWEFALNYFNGTFGPVKSVIDLFSLCPWITHVGSVCAKTEKIVQSLIRESKLFIWQNLWYAKGKYLKNLEFPKLVSDRYYYELWLGRLNCSNLNNLNSAKKNTDSFGTVCYNSAKENCFSLFYQSSGKLSGPVGN